MYFKEVYQTERDRIRAVRRPDGKYPFLGRLAGRDRPENGTVGPVEPTENPEVFPSLNLPESRAVSFINHDLGNRVRKSALSRSISFYFIGGSDEPYGVEARWVRESWVRRDGGEGVFRDMR